MPDDPVRRTTENLNVARALAYGRIHAAHEKAPYLSLPALIALACDMTRFPRMTDTELAEAVERYVLFEAKSGVSSRPDP